MGRQNKDESATPIIGAVREFILTCPFLEAFKQAVVPKVDIEKLNDDAIRYSIESVPVNPIVKKYTDESSVRRFAFVFASTEITDGDVKTRIENSGFYQSFADWMERQSRSGNLPALGEGMESRKIGAITSDYLYDQKTKTGQYQIQCELVYFKAAAQEREE